MQHDIAPNETARVYEAGLLLIPSLPEEKIPSVFTEIKAFIEKSGGSIISEEMPTIRTLAYEMVKVHRGRNIRYNTGYFGWVKFEGAPEISTAVQTYLKESDDVLRFLVIKTVRENTLYSHRIAQAKADAEAEEAKDIEQPEDSSTETDLEKMDKSIDNLVTA